MTQTSARCPHGAHVLNDPPCQVCVAEVAAFRLLAEGRDDDHPLSLP